jgi:hypothetical protein
MSMQFPEQPAPQENVPLIRVAAEAAVRKPVPQTSAPRPSLSHLLLWVACTAAYLAANADLYRDSLSPLALALLVAEILPRGAAWAGLAILAGRQWRGARWPIEPGLWLVALAGAWLILETVVVGHFPKAFNSPSAVLNSASCLLCVIPTLARRLATRWKLFFSLLVLLFAWPLVAPIMNGWLKLDWNYFLRSGSLVQEKKFWLAGAALAIVVYRDHKTGVRHGWLHWAGLTVVVSVVLLGALLLLVAG